ncbi:MAG: S1 RNA-binding domain-containing protein [Armatimonadota bacterium]|nr:S1 RNA-binding domain-containing protein [Armatimonadota bacterium]MDR7402636.1 S1 RNA-binding domain-containing protein [Armatimonadota bacterium]MDR7404986.1 S1 RNA-binding domain-containing protein [Armatimonadota bacterium]MDR7436762.1 S1 RNA-binding domain-containing protein [Armatimonadota bacterium]MDR7472709.1 S1 RNA-binding domain-containing protein [Armatimonadota bacterium]
MTDDLSGERTPVTEEPVELHDRIPRLAERQIVTGTVVRVDTEGVLVDVGAKSEGLIPAAELAREGAAGGTLAVGDRVDVMVMRVEGEEGTIILSKRRADFELAWRRVQEAHQTGKILHAMVVDKVKGGLVVDLGLRGFVPGSHVDLSQAKGRRFEWFVGQSIPLKVLEVDRSKGRVVLSHRLAVEEERQRRKAELLATLQEGMVVEGVVKRLTDFGAFVDLGGADGLLPISEMSWTYIKHPSEVVRRNQRLRLTVLRVDPQTGRISLGLKQILEDPWQKVGEHFRVGDIVRGKVVRLVSSGAFVRLRDLDAFLPVSEAAERRVGRIEDVCKVGETIEAMITEIRPEERRMLLSVRKMERERERRRVKEVLRQQEAEARVTIGDIAGALLQQAVAAASRAPEPPPSDDDPRPEG